MPEYYRVKEPFAYGNLVASTGQIWSSDNPEFKGRERYFEPVEATLARTRALTETATAEPDAFRSLPAPKIRRRRKPAASPMPPAPVADEPTTSPQEETDA